MCPGYAEYKLAKLLSNRRRGTTPKKNHAGRTWDRCRIGKLEEWYEPTILGDEDSCALITRRQESNRAVDNACNSIRRKLMETVFFTWIKESKDKTKERQDE